MDNKTDFVTARVVEDVPSLHINGMFSRTEAGELVSDCSVAFVVDVCVIQVVEYDDAIDIAVKHCCYVVAKSAPHRVDAYAVEKMDEQGRRVVGNPACFETRVVDVELYLRPCLVQIDTLVEAS